VDADWREFLERVSAAVIASDEYAGKLRPGAVADGWVGFEGASEEEIADAEQRLGVSFPPGYRAFLQTTNGFGPVGAFVRRLRPANELVWLPDEDPGVVEIWAEIEGVPAAESSVARTLVVSDEYDDARALLNPSTVDEAGEWEAWFFAHWADGFVPYPSFRALLEHEHESFVDMLKTERGERTPHVAPGLGVAADDRNGLVQALGRPHPYDRAEALTALGNLRDPAAAPAVVARLEDEKEDEYVRESAARALGGLPDQRSVTALMKILRMPYPQGPRFGAERRSDAWDTVIGLKHAARGSLLALWDLARAELAAATRDPDPFIRAEACRTLCYARHHAGEAFELLAPLVEDPDRDVRLRLVSCIEQLHDVRVHGLLVTALRDDDPEVRARAVEVWDRAV
jgi:hypothetical protein